MRPLGDHPHGRASTSGSLIDVHVDSPGGDPGRKGAMKICAPLPCPMRLNASQRLSGLRCGRFRFSPSRIVCFSPDETSTSRISWPPPSTFVMIFRPSLVQSPSTHRSHSFRGAPPRVATTYAPPSAAGLRDFRPVWRDQRAEWARRHGEIDDATRRPVHDAESSIDCRAVPERQASGRQRRTLRGRTLPPSR